jgi:hypothetical protein
MSDAHAASGTPDDVPSREQRIARAESLASGILDGTGRVAANIWQLARFVLFAVYLLLSILSIWLWLIGAVFSTLRFFVRAVMIVFLWLSGGIAPPPGAAPLSLAEAIERDLQYFWRSRVVAYRRVTRGLAEQIVGARRATETFWRWTFARQAFALAVAALMLGIPLAYVIPRPHYVQVTDDNAIEYRVGTEKVIYLVHAVDLFDPTQTREYINEDAVHLGKFNSQGLKAQIVPGRSYRFWVVGIRWWKYPRLFPNIIRAQEVDAQGNVLADPSLHIPQQMIPLAPQ